MKTPIMGRIAGLMTAVAIGIGANWSANAALVLDFTGQSPVPEPTHIAADQYTGNPDASTIAGIFGITAADVGANLYKQNAAGSEENSLAGNYTTVFEDPQYSGPITITWDGGAYANASFLLVKDGDAGSYVWDLRGGLWDGKTTIEIIGNLFVGNNNTFKDVSHVEFYGAVVPEPSTYIAGALLLIPLLAQLRRWKRAA